MSATEERREEARRHETLLKLLTEAERQIMEGRADPELLEAVRRLRPDEAAYFIYELEDDLKRGHLGSRPLRALLKVEEAAMPSLAEYVRQVAGVEVPLRARRGWADKVIEVLRGLPVVGGFEEARQKGLDEFLYVLREGYAAGVVSWERFKEALRHVPLRELLGRHNESPWYLDFVEAAASVPGSYLHVHVVRDDEHESIDIDGILLPVQKGADNKIWHLLKGAISPPDEFMFDEVKGRQYVWLWWD